MRILLDQDCVLADFVAGAAAAWRLHLDDVMLHWPAGQYGMTPVWGKALGDPSFTDATFWSVINRTDRFWHDLPVLPWAHELVDLVRSATDDWYVVTSPSRCDQCVPGKLEWCRRLFGVEWFDRLIPTPHKHLLANPKAVLIDDHEGNVNKFRLHGGRAVLFPCHHNYLHGLKTDPLVHVRKSLDLVVA